jgi:hypothetical protein
MVVGYVLNQYAVQGRMLIQDLLEAVLRILEDETRTVVNSCHLGNQSSLNFVGKAAILGGAPRGSHSRTKSAYGKATDVW